MSKPLRVALYVGSAIAAAIVTAILLQEEAEPRNIDQVSVGGVDLSGLGREDALEALRNLESDLALAAIRVDAGPTSFDLIPAAIGFDLDEEAAVDGALAAGSPDSIIEAVNNPDGEQALSLSISGTIDRTALSQILDRYDQVLGGVFEGGIVLNGATPIPRYPKSGEVIDRASAEDRIVEALFELPRPEAVRLDTVKKHPVLSAAHVDAALEEATLLLSGPITLTRTDPQGTLFLSEDQLARAFRTRVERAPEPHLVVTFDPFVLDEYLEPLRKGFEAPPTDARIVIGNDESIQIVPGFPGALIHTGLVIDAAMQAARRPNRTTVLPLEAGVMPAITAEYLASLNVEGKISEFTTKHRCCAPRVNNIQLFAEALDGMTLLPGETMSLNQAVGKRTEEKGYRPAPTIIKGEITDTVGGGVSQFATTFYNAVFWAGLEILDHRPHSYYFSRYPQGIEATISWPEPDLVFRNDTNSAVIIKTSFTSTSITVKLFGNNADREVSAEVSAPFHPTEFPTDYLPNPEVMPWDEEQEVQAGADGWSVTVTRNLDFAGGATTMQEWTVRYRAWPRQVEVHPCLLPEDSEDYTGEECPVEPDLPADVGSEEVTKTTTEA